LLIFTEQTTYVYERVKIGLENRIFDRILKYKQKSATVRKSP